MKRIISILILLLNYLSSFSQSQVITLEHNHTTYIFNQLDTALKYAFQGDTLYLPGGTISFSGTISKGVSLIGAGYNPDSNSVISPTKLVASTIFLKNKISGLYISGIETNIQIALIATDTASNITIERCRLTNTSSSINLLGNTKNILVKECTIAGAFACSKGAIVNNCVLYESVFCDSAIFNNCIFFKPSSGQGGAGNVMFFYGSATGTYNSIFNNNIFYEPSPYITSFWTSNVNQYFNNIFNSTLNTIFPPPNGSNNVFGISSSAIFQSVISTSFSTSNNFHLKTASPAIGAGLGGVDCGIYGGANSYRTSPFNPHFDHAKIASTTDKDGNLKINLTITSQYGGISNPIAGYRYWIDTAVSKKKQIQLLALSTKAFILEDLNLSNYDTGHHYIYIQAKDFNGVWSSVLLDSFIQLGTPRIDGYTPVIGGNTGYVTMSIYGTGFYEGTFVKLTRTGYPDIIGADSMTIIKDGQRIDVTFDLRAQTTGVWNIDVIVPNDTTMEIPTGFKIELGIPVNPIVKVVGRPIIRASQWQSYTLSYKNCSNIDADMVPVYLALSDTNAVVRFNFSIDTPKNQLLNYSGVKQYVNVNSINETPLTAKVYPLTIKEMKAGQEGTLNFDIQTPNSVTVRTWTNEPVIVGKPNNNNLGECFKETINAIIGLYAGNVVNCGKGVYEAYTGTDFATGSPAKSTVYDYLSIVASCVAAVNPESMVIQVLSGAIGNGNTIRKLVNSCGGVYEPVAVSETGIQVVASLDPNAKYGLNSGGINKYVVNDNDLPYTICFENDSSATALAQTIRIIDTLDTAVIPIANFELGFVKLGGIIVDYPDARKHYTHYIDLRNRGNNAIVKIEAGINDTTGVVQWLFTTLDPETMLLTTDPLAGFLPPNKNKPEGEGSVFFTVKLKDGLPNNTIVKNRAYIYFDNNAPVVTGEWINTIDNIKPHSEVNTLPTFTTDTLINVSWKGTDSTSGVERYNIYVSENGKPYEVWKAQTSLLSDVYIGKMDSTYAFYSIATDTAGNMEDTPLIYDAITNLVPLGVNIINVDNSGIFCQPNPTTGVFTIEGKNLKGNNVFYTITNIIAEPIEKGSYPIENGNLKQSINCLAGQPNGVYIMTIETTGWKKSLKLIKQ